MDINTMAKNFTDFYYATFAQSRESLESLYRPNSMLSFERLLILGASNIVKLYTGLPFETIRFDISTIDAQSLPDMSALLISVEGYLFMDGGEPVPFSQVFVVAKDGDYFYALNDIFRPKPG